jgi:cytochrome d ubiquinol oxidase subunit I
VGFVAVISGWVVTETGRQPWIAEHILRTANAASPVPAASIATTLALFVLTYGTVFSFGIYYINRLIARGLDAPASEHTPQFIHAPITAAHEG